MPSKHVLEARELADRLQDSLPNSIDAASLGVRSKAPFQVLCTREALIWRTEELARNACDALDREDLSVAAILTRAVMESAAVAWKLLDILERRDKLSANEIFKQLEKLLVGSKLWADFPQPYQILKLVDLIDKRLPGFRERYDALSEIAHPNWRGVLGLYSKIDAPKYAVHFGRSLRSPDTTKEAVELALLGSLEIFVHSYNRVTDLMPAFLAELDPS